VSIALTIAIILYVITSLYTPEFDVSVGVVELKDEFLLPLPNKVTSLTVEEAILLRKSIREWSNKPLTLEQLSMLLWSTQGVVEYVGGWLRRAAPSAGATYPLEIYVVIGSNSVALGDGKFLPAGSYKYDFRRHSIRLVKEGDLRSNLYEATYWQDWVRDAPISIVISAVYERTTSRYGERGIRYVVLEAGHVGQNIYLMATALGLGTVAIGAFNDKEVAMVIGVKRGEEILYIFPVGVPLKPHRASFDDIHAIYSRLRR